MKKQKPTVQKIFKKRLPIIAIIKRCKEVIFLLILVLLVFHNIILHPTQMLYPGADIASIYASWRWTLVTNILHFGEIPLWNPSLFSGTPFIGNSQSGIFYPFTLFFFLFPINTTFGYLFVLDVFLLGLFTYFFAKSIKINNFSSLFSAVTIMLSGTILYRLYPGHLFIIDTFIWFPLLLLLFELGIQKRKVQYGILSGYVIALMYFAGSIQIAYYCLLTALLYYLHRYVLVAYKRKKKIDIILLSIPFLALVIGLCLSTVQLLPSLELSKYSGRQLGVTYEFASSFSIPPKQLVSFLLPHFFGDGTSQSYWGKGNPWEFCGYIGIFPLIAACIAILKRKNTDTFFFLILAISSLLFSFGSYTPLFQLFYSYVPGFNLFRVPARILFIYAFSMAIIAGIGVQFLTEKVQKNNDNLKKFWYVLCVLSSISMLILSWITIQRTYGIDLIRDTLSQKYAITNPTLAFNFIYNDFFLFTALLCFSTCILFLRLKNLLNIRSIKMLCITIVILDLLFFGYNFTTTKEEKDVLQKPSFLKNIEKNKSEKFRIFDMTGRLYVVTTQAGLENVTGYDAIYLQNYRDYLWAIGPHMPYEFEPFIVINSIKHIKLLELLNVQYIISKDQLSTSSDLTLINHESYYLYKLPHVFPRAFLVPNALVIKNQKNILPSLTSEKLDPKQFILLEKNPNKPLHNPSKFTPIALTSFSSNKITIDVTTTQAGYLTLSEIWYPGWKAYDNGKEIEIFKSDAIFRSLYLTSGKHSLLFQFQPLSYTIGAIISLTALMLSIIGYMLLRRYE